MKNQLPNRERMKIQRQHMPERDAAQRAACFAEVNLGYTPELARCEAHRCIACQKPTCMTGCPVGVKVKEFVDLVAGGDYLGAADLYAGIGSLPDEADARLRSGIQSEVRRALEFYLSVGATRYIHEGEALLAASA